MAKGHYEWQVTITCKKTGHLHCRMDFDDREEAEQCQYDCGRDWNHREYGSAGYDIVVKRIHVREGN